MVQVQDFKFVLGDRVTGGSNIPQSVQCGVRSAIEHYIHKVHVFFWRMFYISGGIEYLGFAHAILNVRSLHL